MNFLLVYATVSVLILCSHGSAVKWLPDTTQLASIYKWNILKFDFPTRYAKQLAEATGNLQPANAIPIDIQPTYNLGHLRTFVTIPRFQNGIPYTLATVSIQHGSSNPYLQPYPNYEAHNNGIDNNCDAITSAFRVIVNECQQMWVIDSGRIGSQQKCPPQLLLFDLFTDKLIHRYRFDSSLYTPNVSLFISVIAYTKHAHHLGNCRHSMIYVADVSLHGLVVYDYLNNNAWRIENRFMYPDPDYGLHTVAGEDFLLMDGIFSLATDKKKLYFHALASVTEYSVPLRVINNKTLFESSVENMPGEFVALGTRRSQCAASAIDSRNYLYCVTFNPIKLLAWQVNTPYNSENIIELPVIPEYLEFVSGMKLVTNLNGEEELWMISNRLQKMYAGTRDFYDINFNIVKVNIDDVHLHLQELQHNQQLLSFINYYNGYSHY